MTRVLVLLFTLTFANSAHADLLSTMSRFDGMHERTNRVELRKTIGVDPSIVPWCGYMLSYVVKKNGKTPPSNAGSASAWKNYGTPVSRSKVRIGHAIAVVRGGLHVGVYVGTDKRGRTCVMAGNTTNRTKKACYSGKAWIRQ